MIRQRNWITALRSTQNPAECQNRFHKVSEGSQAPVRLSFAKLSRRRCRLRSLTINANVNVIVVEDAVSARREIVDQGIGARRGNWFGVLWPEKNPGS